MHHTLEDIIPPSRRKKMAEQISRQHTQEKKDIPSRPKKRRGYGATYKPSIIAIVIIVLAVGVLYFVSDTKVTVDPMTNTAPLSLTLTAYASSTSPLPFAIVTIEKTASQRVSSTGSKKVSRTASGTLTIYNTLPRIQRLVKNTRFASSNGLIFTIHNAVRVPVAHGIIPGSLTVTAYATAPGSEYNVAPGPFTVPGLANTSLKDKIYAKSSRAMSGGYLGTQPLVAKSVVVKARAALQKALTKSLAQSIQKQIPDDYVLLSGAATTTFSVAPIKSASTTDKALIQENGIITAVILPANMLAKTIESHIMGSYAGQPVRIVNPRTIKLNVLSGFPKRETSVFNFSLSGTVTISWAVNSIRIATAIAGKTRNEAATILSGFPEIKKAYLTLRPFWIHTFPSDPAKITIVVNKPASKP